MAINEEDIIREKFQIAKITDYLLELYHGKINKEDAEAIANTLYYYYSIDMSKILFENNQKVIDDIVKKYMIRRNSIYKEDEERKPIPLQSNRRKPKVPTFIQVAAGSLAMVSMFFIYPKLAEPKPEEINVSYALGSLVSDASSTNIVDKNTYQVGVDDKYRPIFAYNHQGIVSDIIKICKKNPDLFDFVLNEVYKELDRNRLENMDEIFRCLKIEISNDESLGLLYERINDCDIFLDYIDTLGYIKSDDEYKAFEEYDNNQSPGKEIGSVFSKLTKEDQKVLENIMKKYREDNTFKEFNDQVKNLLENEDNDYEPGSAKLGGL